MIIYDCVIFLYRPARTLNEMPDTIAHLEELKAVKSELLAYIKVTNLSDVSKLKIMELIDAIEMEVYKII